MSEERSLDRVDANLPERLRVRWKRHSQLLLNSFRDRTGQELLERSGNAIEEAERLFLATFVVVSHGTEPDPILNCGNKAALSLWEMSADALIITPSRSTAEPMLQEAREHLLEETASKGFVSGYEGVRISATGKQFRILDVTIWNLSNSSDRPLGQAATFPRWLALD